MQLRIPTDSLRKLLDENPVIKAELEAMACEKIAEEIMRKATTKDLSQLMADTQKNAMAEITRAMRTPSNWPAELRTAIETKVNGHLKDQRVAMIEEFRKELAKMLDEATKEAKASLDRRIEELTLAHRENLRTYARRDFVAVVEEVQKGLTPAL